MLGNITADMSSTPVIALIGAGTIGLSFVATHINEGSPSGISIFDPAPNLLERIQDLLPIYLKTTPNCSLETNKSKVESWLQTGFIKISASLQEAVQNATLVQEQLPENLELKQDNWASIEKFASKECIFWSSTSGITSTQQSAKMIDKSRLLVVHPFNPPHIMPLIEIVPSPVTDELVISWTLKYWRELGREPVVVQKEITGFVANRLAFAVLRESVHLVNEGVIDVEGIDAVVTSSLGPRWAVVGPFKSYHMGGGPTGFRGFIQNIGGTVQDCWDDAGSPNVKGGLDEIFQQTDNAYGLLSKNVFEERDRKTKGVLGITMERRNSL